MQSAMNPSTRSLPEWLLLFPLICLPLLGSCQSTKTYEGNRYKVSVDSSPTGGNLFIIKQKFWTRIAPDGGIPDQATLEQYDLAVSPRGKANVSPNRLPAVDLELPETDLILVVLHPDGQGLLKIAPTRDGESHLVRLK